MPGDHGDIRNIFSAHNQPCTSSLILSAEDADVSIAVKPQPSAPYPRSKTGRSCRATTLSISFEMGCMTCPARYDTPQLAKKPERRRALCGAAEGGGVVNSLTLLLSPPPLFLVCCGILPPWGCNRPEVGLCTALLGVAPQAWMVESLLWFSSAT